MHALPHAHTPSDRALFSHIQQAEAEQQDVEDLLHHCTSLAASCPTLQAAESASTIPLKCQAMHVPKPLHLRARAGRQDALQTLVQVHHRPADGAVPGGRQLPQRRRYAAPVVRPLAAVAADKRPALPAFAAGIVMLQACDRGFVRTSVWLTLACLAGDRLGPLARGRPWCAHRLPHSGLDYPADTPFSLLKGKDVSSASYLPGRTHGHKASSAQRLDNGVLCASPCV